MAETLTTNPNPQESYRPIQAEGVSREDLLRKLLPVDYEYAAQQGLIDMFYYNPEEGEDGLLHTLAGNRRPGKNGGFESEGYHHEDSGMRLAALNEEDTTPRTRVDRTHLIDAKAKHRALFRERPLEPYDAQVVVDGLRRTATHVDPVTGEERVARARVSMFPKEQDALSVLWSVRTALERRDPTKDVLVDGPHGTKVLSSISSAPLLDGKTDMPMKLVLDPASEKVISAMPIVKKSGILGLTPEGAEKVIFGDLIP